MQGLCAALQPGRAVPPFFLPSRLHYQVREKEIPYDPFAAADPNPHGGSPQAAENHFPSCKHHWTAGGIPGCSVFFKTVQTGHGDDGCGVQAGGPGGNGIGRFGGAGTGIEGAEIERDKIDGGVSMYFPSGYRMMFDYLDSLYQRTRADELGGLLGYMSLLGDGEPAGPAYGPVSYTHLQKALSYTPQIIILHPAVYFNVKTEKD